MKSKTISLSIDAAPSRVYEFVSNPRNLPAWAPFFQSVENVEGKWIIRTEQGIAELAFAQPNVFGVLDHTIAFDSGPRFHNPMRVVPNGSGSELMFTLFQQQETTDEQFQEDADQVLADLDSLRRRLESNSER